MNDLGASFSKRLRCQGAETVGDTNFYLGKGCNKNIYNGLSLQENKHKQELPNLSNAHERTKFRNLISAWEVLSVVEIQEMCVLQILQMRRSQALCIYVLAKNIRVKVQRCERIKL